MKLPTWKEYEEKCGYPVTYGEYVRFLRMNYKDQIDEDEGNAA